MRMESRSFLDARPPAAIHVDLDGESAIHAIHGRPYHLEVDPLFESGLLNTLRFLDNVGLKATLFVVAQDLDNPRKRMLIEEAVKRGHEIASHTLTHRRLTDLDHNGKHREIHVSRERLAKELNLTVSGFRAPNYEIDLEGLELVNSAGYTYDSSLVPGMKLEQGFGGDCAIRARYVPLKSGRLAEIPLPFYRPLPWPFHPSYSLILGLWYFRLGLRRFRRTGSPLILLFHLTDLVDPLPYGRLPGWKAKVCSIPYLSSRRKHNMCRRMVELVRRDYRIVETAQLIAMTAKGPSLDAQLPDAPRTGSKSRIS